MQGLISVIVPVYNCSEFLDKCITSILNQSYSKFELFLINDGSTDDSLDICKRYAALDARISVFNSNNEGAGKARNKGLDSSSGDFIFFVDADDWIETRTLESLMQHMTPDVDLVFLKGKKVYKDGTIEPCFNYFKDTVKFNSDKVFEMIINEQIGSQPVQALYRKKQWDNIRFNDTRFEDLATTYKTIYGANNIVFLNQVLYNYRMNEHSTTHTKTRELSYPIFNAFYLRYLFVKKNKLTQFYDACCAFAAHYALTTLIKKSLTRKLNKFQLNEIKGFLENNKETILKNKQRLPKNRRFLPVLYYRFKLIFLVISNFI